MMPFDGEAFFTSQIKDMPGFFSACSNGNPVSGFIAVECDDLPESCFLFAGTIDEVFEKAKALNQ